MLSDFVLSWTFDILDRLNYEIHRNWCSTNIDETVVPYILTQIRCNIASNLKYNLKSLFWLCMVTGTLLTRIFLEVWIVDVNYMFYYSQLAVQVTLFISDVNDEVPEFVNLRYKESIYEVIVIDWAQCITSSQ